MTQRMTNAEAAAAYEQDVDFIDEALNELVGADTIPDWLIAQITTWYRTTDQYDRCVALVIADAETD
jgi:hypothetical protein